MHKHLRHSRIGGSRCRCNNAHTRSTWSSVKMITSHKYRPVSWASSDSVPSSLARMHAPAMAYICFRHGKNLACSTISENLKVSVSNSICCWGGGDKFDLSSQVSAFPPHRKKKLFFLFSWEQQRPPATLDAGSSTTGACSLRPAPTG